MGAKRKLGLIGLVVIGGVVFTTCTTTVERGHVATVFDRFNL